MSQFLEYVLAITIKILKTEGFVVSSVSALLSTIELLQKFGVHSFGPMLRRFGFYAYIGVNIGAAMLVLSCYPLLIPLEKNPILAVSATKIVICAGGAMILARSSFFQVKESNGNMVDVGIASILKACAEVIDKGIDASLTRIRFKIVKDALKGLNYDEVTERLPVLCLGGLARFPSTEKNALYAEISSIKNSPSLPQDQITLIGMTLLLYVGRDVIKEASKCISEGRENVNQDAVQLQQLEERLLG